MFQLFKSFIKALFLFQLSWDRTITCFTNKCIYLKAMLFGPLSQHSRDEETDSKGCLISNETHNIQVSYHCSSVRIYGSKEGYPITFGAPSLTVEKFAAYFRLMDMDEHKFLSFEKRSLRCTNRLFKSHGGPAH